MQKNNNEIRRQVLRAQLNFNDNFNTREANDEPDDSFYSATEENFETQFTQIQEIKPECTQINQENDCDESFVSAIEFFEENHYDCSYSDIQTAGVIQESANNICNEINQFVPNKSIQLTGNGLVQNSTVSEDINATNNETNLGHLDQFDVYNPDNSITEIIQSLLNISCNSTLSESIFETFNELIRDDERKFFSDIIPDCQILQLFVDEIKKRETYYQERKIQKQELDNLFEVAVLKTDIERNNLNLKGQVNKRYVNIFKRLSLNSQNISQEAINARESYNKAAKKYNESIQSFKKLEVTPEIHQAFINLMYINHEELKINAEDEFLTARDFYDSKKYEAVLKKFMH